MSTELAQVKTLDPETLMVKAIESNVSVETMERLLGMRKDLLEEQAKTEFYRAMSRFQAECPIIQKTKTVKSKNGDVRYKYAPLEDIIKQVKEFLNKHGLSYSFKTIPAVDAEVGVNIVCVAKHVMGHSEESSVFVPIEKDAFMNDAQKSGSAQSYAKRYAFCNAFGIVIGDEDDDGSSLGNGVTPQQIYAKAQSHMRAVLENIDTVMTVKRAIEDENLELAAEAMAEIDDARVLSNLFLAPTKGGCFTVEEKKAMGTDEYKQFYGKYREGREMEGL